jgi:serine/threonine protein kinase
MLSNEINQHSQLEHQHILKFLDSEIDVTYRQGRDSAQVGFISTELLPKGDFLSFLMGKGGLPAPVVKYYARQLISGINYMH